MEIDWQIDSLVVGVVLVWELLEHSATTRIVSNDKKRLKYIFNVFLSRNYVLL